MSYADPEQRALNKMGIANKELMSGAPDIDVKTARRLWGGGPSMIDNTRVIPDGLLDDGRRRKEWFEI